MSSRYDLELSLPPPWRFRNVAIGAETQSKKDAKSTIGFEHEVRDPGDGQLLGCDENTPAALMAPQEAGQEPATRRRKG